MSALAGLDFVLGVRGDETSVLLLLLDTFLGVRPVRDGVRTRDVEGPAISSCSFDKADLLILDTSSSRGSDNILNSSLSSFGILELLSPEPLLSFLFPCCMLSSEIQKWRVLNHDKATMNDFKQEYTRSNQIFQCYTTASQKGPRVILS